MAAKGLQADLYNILDKELIHRHGFGMMGNRAHPANLANAMMRQAHECRGAEDVLNRLFGATATHLSEEDRRSAVDDLIAQNPERWGRLGEVADRMNSPLVRNILPQIRNLISTDKSVVGVSVRMSSLSTPTVVFATHDTRDLHAGDFVFKLWSDGDDSDPLPILGLFRRLTSHARKPQELDDISAVLSPLFEEVKPYHSNYKGGVDLSGKRSPSPTLASMREAGRLLARYEEALRPSPIASLQRIVELACLTAFFHASTRGHEWAGLPRRPMLVDMSGDPNSLIAKASTHLTTLLFNDARDYMGSVMRDLLVAVDPDWIKKPIDSVKLLLALNGKSASESSPVWGELADLVQEETPEQLEKELIAELVRAIGPARGLDNYLRLTGPRVGLLYPSQRNPKKRCVPTDRTLEVLVAGAMDLAGTPIEYRDFLDCLYERWGIITGGRSEDAQLLAAQEINVPSRTLTENSERFLSRLESLGFAKRMADTVAMVGLLDNTHD